MDRICPDCRKPMVKEGRTRGRHGGVNYTCETADCPVIERREYYRHGLRTLRRIKILRDPVLMNGRC